MSTKHVGEFNTGRPCMTWGCDAAGISSLLLCTTVLVTASSMGEAVTGLVGCGKAVHGPEASILEGARVVVPEAEYLERGVRALG